MAGHEVRNGGFATLCKVGNETKLIIVDAAESNFSIPHDILADASQNDRWRGSASTILSRLKPLDPGLEFILQVHLSTLSENLKLVSSFPESLELYDVGKLKISDSCSGGITQIATQVQTESGVMLHVLGSAWDQLDSGQKMILLMHEVIYGYFATLGHTDSALSREFVRFLLAVDNQTYEEYAALRDRLILDIE